MSALGQKRTLALQNGMSALPPIATPLTPDSDHESRHHILSCCARQTLRTMREHRRASYVTLRSYVRRISTISSCARPSALKGAGMTRRIYCPKETQMEIETDIALETKAGIP